MKMSPNSIAILAVRIVYLKSITNFVKSQENNSSFHEIDTSRETPLYPPQFVPYDRCGCDLLLGFCDTFCCCDGDCSKEDREAIFGCQPTTPESQGVVPLTCELPSFIRREPLFLFLCTARSLTPYLGHFYPNIAIGKSEEDYNSNSKSRTSPVVYGDAFDDVFQRPAETLYRASYKHGAPVATSEGYLSLPQPSLAGQCTWSSPIRYLVAVEAACSWRLTEESCAQLTALSADSFQTPPLEFLEAREMSPDVLSTPERSSVPVPVKVKYLCRRNLAENAESKRKISNSESYWFRLNFDKENSAEEFVECEIPAGNSVPDRPEVSEIPNGMLLCNNTVVQADYVFLWNASESREISATVFLDNVQVISDTTVLSQKFSVSWKNPYSAAESTEKEEFENIERSGSPGYIIGRPLLAFTENRGKMAFEHENQLFIWKPDSSGLCQYSQREKLPFGLNTTSSCYLQLSRTDFNDCQMLQNRLFQGVNNLHQASHLSKFGTITSLNVENYIQILRQNLTFLELGDTDLEILSLLENGTESEQAKPVVYRTRFKPGINDLIRYCAFLPHHMTLDILYTEAGYVNGVSIYEIVGAFVSYNFTKWRYASLRMTQRFLVTSSVRFYKKDPLPPPETTRFHLQRGRFHCPSHVTCWEELFYPFREMNLSATFSFSLSMGLATIATIVLGYCITKPWAT